MCGFANGLEGRDWRGTQPNSTGIMSVKVLLEIGHISELKAKPANGFTHDWELFVRSYDSHDIAHFIDKVVFNLHESFTKPKRSKGNK